MRNLINHGFAILGVSFALTFVASVLGLFLHSPSPVQCATITPNAILSGKIQWVENLPANSIGFSYAILYIDGEARSINNELPLRFDLDTTKLRNGRHTLKVVFYDADSKIGESPETPVIASNMTAVPKVVNEPVKPVTAPLAATVPAVPEVTTSTATLATEKSLKIYYHEKPIDHILAPYQMKHRVMALLRPLTIAAGGSLKWDGEKGTTVINRHTMRFTLNSHFAEVDGRKVKLVRPLVIRQDRVFAPICVWRDLFKGPTEYEPKTRSIILGEIGIGTNTANL